MPSLTIDKNMLIMEITVPVIIRTIGTEIKDNLVSKGFPVAAQRARTILADIEKEKEEKAKRQTDRKERSDNIDALEEELVAEECEGSNTDNDT